METTVRSRLQMLDRIAESDAPVTRMVLADRPVVFVNDPELVRELLVTRASSFEKSDFQRHVMGGAEGAATGLGNGLLTSSNELNRRQRAQLGGMFQHAAMQRYLHDVAAIAREERARWAAAGTVELGSAFMWLSARIVARTLFSWELGPDDRHLVGDLELIGDLLGRPAADRDAGWADPAPLEQAAARIEAGLLAHAGGTDRDRLMTLFLTGVENPRNALVWTMYLLARHPQAAERIRAEVRQAGAADGPLSVDVMARLPYTLRVFKEALRLYPPGYAFGRRAVERVRVGNLVFDWGADVVVSPYVMHRRPSLFERPREFDPDRFERGIRPLAYLPFGAGPRSCVGGGFALLVGHVVLAVLLGDLRFRLLADEAVTPQARMTLRPGGPVAVSVQGGAGRG